MATFLICHGAWSAGWAWKKVRPLLRAAGHEVFTPTYTGVGERAHQASPAVDLETHIKDVLAVIELDEGWRMNSNIVNVDPKDVTVGMRVEVVWDDVTPEISLPKFRPIEA